MTSTSLLTPAPIGGAARSRGRLAVAFGPRAIAFLAFGFVWAIPVFFDPRYAALLVAWNGLVIAAWLIDLATLARPGDISVTRRWLAPAALSVSGEVELDIVNAAARMIVVRVVDAVPAGLRASAPESRVDVPGRGEATARYQVTPVVRGETRLGGIHLRYESVLRLAQRWATVDLAQTVVTYPNLREARRHAVHLVRSRQVSLERRSSRVRGAGRAFESLREYRSGDEVRDVCWTASARRGKAVVRQYEIERSQTIWVLLDSGRLMRARVSGLSKLDYAVNAALSLSQVALAGGDRVGLLAYGRHVSHRLPAAKGSAHLKQIVEHLARVREDEWEADHVLAASRLLIDQKRRSLVVWITDLAETAMTPEVVRAASHLASRHVVLFVVIGEPDLQQTARRTPATVREMYDTAAAQEFLLRRESLQARLRARGATTLETTAADLPIGVINGYLAAKERNRI